MQSLTTLPSPADAQNSLTFDAAVRNTYAPSSVGEVTPLPGGQHFARLSPDGKQVLRYDFQTGKQDGVLFDVAQIEDCPFETAEGYVVSPDGSKIIYTGYYRTGFMDLLLIDLNTNTRKVFAAYKGSNTGGSFSPDGTRVATILTSTGNAEVWTASANGGGFKRITNTSATESTPSFSPDGRTLIFAGDYRGAPQIYTAPATGGKPSVVRTNISGYCSEPVWNKVNPDLIAFTIAQGKGFQIAVYNFRTKQTKVVSRGASTSGPKWLNDGRHIICTKSNGANRQLYIIDTETDSQKPLHTTSFGSAKEPDFVYTAR